MCGFAAIINVRGEAVPDITRRLEVMNQLLEHRGPDGSGVWAHPRGHVGLAHRRLAIIDIEHGAQPMVARNGDAITYNGEVYNHVELRRELSGASFRTRCDTEVVLEALSQKGLDALLDFRGMFAFAWWDERSQRLVCARDRFGIKPAFYAQVGDVVYLASEAKALMPFLPDIQTNYQALSEYLAFQFTLGEQTLFDGVKTLLPAHFLEVRNGSIASHRYWDVEFEIDWAHTGEWFEDELRALLSETADLHLRSDVPVAAYLSGGLDSSTVATLAAKRQDSVMTAYTGRFEGNGYDESPHAQAVADAAGIDLRIIDISVEDFLGSLDRLIYHLDFPTAGPGSFPQFIVSENASRSHKVILGGQGGDEIFGGYTRYLIAYFEQCIKAAIQGVSDDKRFVVTYESIIPNLESLSGYEPLLQRLWSKGLFEELDARYYRLIDRSGDLDYSALNPALLSLDPRKEFSDLFNSPNVNSGSYFDKMTHFDFKTLLPALLQVEDRVSMAHGLESRVPLLDHRIVELAATAPANIKFQNGEMKHLFRKVASEILPPSVSQRKDKMGFPVPLVEWMAGPAAEFVRDTLSTEAAERRDIFDRAVVLDGLNSEGRFGRQVWGFLSLELWQQQYHDRASNFRRLVSEGAQAQPSP